MNSIPARHKVHGHQGQGRENVVRGIQKGLNFGERRRAEPRGNNGMRNQDMKKQLRLRKERSSGRIFRKTEELKVRNQIVETSIRLRQMRAEHCGGIGLLRNENCTRSKIRGYRSIDHSRNFCPHQPEEDDGDKPGPTGTLSGDYSGRAAISREQRERLYSKYCEKQTQLSERKKQWHTDKLLVTRGLKKGTVWRICSKQELWSQRNSRC
jgi:hypothetical protein